MAMLSKGRLTLGAALLLIWWWRKRVQEKAKQRAAVRRARKCAEKDVRVAICGAGASGMAMAVKLQEAGIPFVIFEKSDKYGGTWNNNAYPDAACDVPCFFYSFSFAQKSDWTRKWAKQPEILAYFNSVAKQFGLEKHTRFHTAVEGASFDKATKQWTLRLSDGTEERFTALVSGVGQLDRPKFAEIEGMDSFKGPVFHTAEWRQDVDLKGKRVVGIGNGPSAIQAFPAIADDVDHLTVLQRSSIWCFPKKDFEYPKAVLWIFRHIPGVRWLYRCFLYWSQEVTYWAIFPNSVRNSTNELVAKFCSFLVKRDLANKPNLLTAGAALPDYPVGCKRLALTDDWVPMLARSNVSLEMRKPKRVLADGIEFEDGSTVDADVIIHATGFKSTDFLGAIDIRNGDGVKLAEHWRGTPHAYNGMSISEFSNMFVLYGPGSNLGHSSILFMVECQVDYITRLLCHMVDHDLSCATVKPEAYEEDFATLQRNLKQTVFTSDECDSWYKNKDGVVVNNWSGTCTEYFFKLRKPDFDRYTFA